MSVTLFIDKTIVKRKQNIFSLPMQFDSRLKGFIKILEELLPRCDYRIKSKATYCAALSK